MRTITYWAWISTHYSLLLEHLQLVTRSCYFSLVCVSLWDLCCPNQTKTWFLVLRVGSQTCLWMGFRDPYSVKQLKYIHRCPHSSSWSCAKLDWCVTSSISWSWLPTYLGIWSLLHGQRFMTTPAWKSSAIFCSMQAEHFWRLVSWSGGSCSQSWRILWHWSSRLTNSLSMSGGTLILILVRSFAS